MSTRPWLFIRKLSAIKLLLVGSLRDLSILMIQWQQAFQPDIKVKYESQGQNAPLYFYGEMLGFPGLVSNLPTG